MELHRFVLRPRSSWGMLLRSDTLYGLLLWRMAEDSGPEECIRAIEAFRSGEAPFEVSSAMPRDCLPMPCLPPVPRARFRAFVEQGRFRMRDDNDMQDDSHDPLFDALQRFREFRKSPWLPLEAWIKHGGALSMASLFAWHCGQARTARVDAAHQELAFEPHVSIDRKAGSAIKGGLFFTRLHYFASDVSFHIYVRADDPESLLRSVRKIGLLGFGRDSSTGKGLFDAELDSSFNPASLEADVVAGGKNARLLLSVCAASDMSDLEACYGVEVKRGKTGPRPGSPFKNPFLMLREGAIIARPPRGPFVLDHINPDPAIAQITHPMTLPCRLEGEE